MKKKSGSKPRAPRRELSPLELRHKLYMQLFLALMDFNTSRKMPKNYIEQCIVLGGGAALLLSWVRNTVMESVSCPRSRRNFDQYINEVVRDTQWAPSKKGKKK